MIPQKSPLQESYITIAIFICLIKLGLVADPVFNAIARLEFEDGLRTIVLPGGYWCPWGSCTYPRIDFKPLWGYGLVLGWVWLSEGPHFRPNSNLLGSVHRWY